MSDALDRLLSDDLSWTHSSARQDTKASFLVGLQALGTRYLEIRRSDEQVRLHGEVAVVTGIAHMRVSINGEERQLRNRYTNVWTKSEKGLADDRLAVHRRPVVSPVEQSAIQAVIGWGGRRPARPWR